MKIFIFKVLTLPVLALLLLLLWVVYPFCKITISILNVGRIGHLGLNTETVLREMESIDNNELVTRFDKIILIAPTLPNKYVSNKQLLKMYSRNQNVYTSWFFYHLIAVWHHELLKYRFFFHSNNFVFTNEYNLYNSVQTTLSFTLDETSKGLMFLSKIGLHDKKYVCIFERDENYLALKENKDQSARSCRDADIEAMIPSIKFLIDYGYKVVRVGAHAKNKVNFSHPDFIDYPFSEYLSDFNDLFLISNSSAMIGSHSGICDVATLFDIPRLVVNAVPYAHAPYSKNCMFIPKKITKNGNIVPYYDSEIYSLRFNHSCNDVESMGYEYIDNSEDEILSAVNDFIAYLSNHYHIESDYDNEMRKYHRHYTRDSLFDQVKTPICKSWLYSNYELYYEK